MSVHDDLPPPPSTSTIWRAEFATRPSTLDELVMITIPAWSTVLQLGPCFWQSRDDTLRPFVGDPCLAFLDDEGDWWVIAWWPSSPGGAGPGA